MVLRIFEDETVIITGGGAGAPTVTYLDDIGMKDSDTFAWTMSDDVGAKDAMSVEWALGDTVGQKDSSAVAWTLADDVGLRDSDMILNIGLGDDVGVKDAMSLAWTLGDTEGLRDGAAITGQGTPQWQSVSTAFITSNSTLINVNAPSGLQVGDLMLALVGNNSSTITATISGLPSGWTAIQTQSFGGVGFKVCGTSAWKIAVAGDIGATFTFSTPVGNSNGWTAEIHRITGFNTTTPINTSGVATLLTTALVTSPVGPAVTTTVTNCLIFQWLFHCHAATSASHTVASPYTERADFESASLAAIGASTSDTGIQGTAGSSGTVTHTCTETVATDAIMQAVAVAPGAININL